MLLFSSSCLARLVRSSLGATVGLDSDPCGSGGLNANGTQLVTPLLHDEVADGEASFTQWFDKTRSEAGIRQSWAEIFRTAVELIAAQLAHNECGLPSCPRWR